MASIDPASRRYLLRTTLFMGGYVIINVAAILGAFDDIGRIGGLVLGLAVAAPVAGQIWATLALMKESDEFVRALMARRFILAAGVAMALFSAWGFLESYGDAPHAPGWLVFAVFWAAYGVITPFVRETRG